MGLLDAHLNLLLDAFGVGHIGGPRRCGRGRGHLGEQGPHRVPVRQLRAVRLCAVGGDTAAPRVAQSAPTSTTGTTGEAAVAGGAELGGLGFWAGVWRSARNSSSPMDPTPISNSARTTVTTRAGRRRAGGAAAR